MRSPGNRPEIDHADGFDASCLDFVIAHDLSWFFVALFCDVGKALVPGLSFRVPLAKLALIKTEGHLRGVLPLELQNSFLLVLDDGAEFLGFLFAASPE